MISTEYMELLNTILRFTEKPEHSLNELWDELKIAWKDPHRNLIIGPRLLSLAYAGIWELKAREQRSTQHYVHVLKDLHKRKNAGYSGDNPDPWANFRYVTEFDIPTEIGVLTRLCDKYARYSILKEDPTKDQVDESIIDTLLDFVAYSLILACILGEYNYGAN